MHIHDDIKNDVLGLSHKLRVKETLKAFAVSTRFLSDKKRIKSSDYILLILDTEKATIQINSYKQSEIGDAVKDYLKEERQSRSDETKNVVLVAATSIRNLKQAYPNYFADTDEFVHNMENITS